ncbi:MAG: winged helix-turn-helix transcriptional regulator [Candidatus Woesearchaeota archaeon]
MIGRFSEEMGGRRVKTDLRDRKILAILSEHSRMPVSRIAKQSRMSSDVARYRINRLKRLGVIQRYVPIINFKHFGCYIFHVLMSVDEQDKAGCEQLMSDLQQEGCVLSIIEYSDRWDFEVTILARTLPEFDKIITNLVSKYPKVIIEKKKLETIKNYNIMHFPTGLYSHMPGKRKIRVGRNTSIDKTDIRLITELARDASRSDIEIGKAMNMSADAVSYRTKKLLDLGVIMKFTVLINLTLLDFHWYTFCIRVRVLDSDHDSKFKEFVRHYPTILRACKTLGDYDLLLYIVAESPKSFHDIVKQIRHEFADIIITYETWVGYKEHYYNAFPENLAR